MRSHYPIPPLCLDDKRLKGEHAEVHAMLSILLGDRKGYRHHPEVRRWEGHLPALRERHEQLVVEMARRGIQHKSPVARLEGDVVWPGTWESVETMRIKLALKQNGALGEVLL